MTEYSFITKTDCNTFIAVWLECDIEKCDAAIAEGRVCTPEEIGITNKDEIEKFIIEEIGVTPRWDYHLLLIGFNFDYDVDVNKMLRITLKDLFGKEDKLKLLQEKFSVPITLEIVPYIEYQSNEPKQILSLERDIIEFLHKSDVKMSLFYQLI